MVFDFYLFLSGIIVVAILSIKKLTPLKLYFEGFQRKKMKFEKYEKDKDHMRIFVWCDLDSDTMWKNNGFEIRGKQGKESLG